MNHNIIELSKYRIENEKQIKNAEEFIEGMEYYINTLIKDNSQ